MSTRDAIAGQIEASLLDPLREPVFRRIWTSSLLSNFALLTVGITAAWEMTRLSEDATLVALVQSAIMAPFMAFALLAGALADIFDRRKIGLFALLFSAGGAAGLTVISMLGMATPHWILAMCFLTGLGLALFGPAWQSSVSEQVPPRLLPSAIALNGISFNIARSIGPAIGGALVATVGTVVTFGVSFVLFVPLYLALLTWRRKREPSRFPAERLHGALAAGLRYAYYSPGLTHPLIRACSIAFAVSSIHALVPLVARDLLGGGAGLYGVLLSSFGVGSILGAATISRIQTQFEPETILRVSTMTMAFVIGCLGVSDLIWLTILSLCLGGFCWMTAITLMNVLIQTAAPRWVTARVLGLFQTLVFGGLAVGSWVWGEITSSHGLAAALACAAAAMFLSLIFGLLRPLDRTDGQANPPGEDRPDPQIALAITGRSGPITMEIEYHIAPPKARDFYQAMLELRRIKRRNGARRWALARDLHDPAIWVERYQYATWDDYLRNRNRDTEAEQSLQSRITALSEDGEIILRRFLDRPVGSVRRSEETPDSVGDGCLPSAIS